MGFTFEPGVFLPYEDRSSSFSFPWFYQAAERIAASIGFRRSPFSGPLTRGGYPEPRCFEIYLAD